MTNTQQATDDRQEATDDRQKVTDDRQKVTASDKETMRIALFGIGMNIGLCIFYAPYNITNPLLEIIVRLTGFIIMVISALELMKGFMNIFVSYKING